MKQNPFDFLDTIDGPLFIYPPPQNAVNHDFKAIEKYVEEQLKKGRTRESINPEEFDQFIIK